MALRNIRSNIREQGAWRGRFFRSTPHIGTVLIFGGIAAIAFAYGAAQLLNGEQTLDVFFVAVMFGLYAWDNWRRLSFGQSAVPEVPTATPSAKAHSKHGAREPAATWQCPTCGELIEQQFDACWKCSAEHDLG